MRRLLAIVFAAILLFTSTKSVYAFPKEIFVSFAFPIHELADNKTLTLPREIIRSASASATPLTWYLSYDSLDSLTTIPYFQTVSQLPNQEVSVLLDVTPKLLSDTQILSGSVPTMLNSYLPTDRKKLIDQIFTKYYSQFGVFPRSVYAPYIDSYSLQYLHEHYSITAAIINEQPGVFPYISYYPSTQNTLVPGQDADHRIKLVLGTFNTPDLFGNQITSNNIDQTFQDLSPIRTSESSRIILGTDNSTPVDSYLPEFKSLIKMITERTQQPSVHRITISDFGNWFAANYPLTSPAFDYTASSGDTKVLYYHNPFYQLKLEQKQEKAKITSLTIFHQSQTEEFRQQRNLSTYFRPSIFPVITSEKTVALTVNIISDITSQDWRLSLSTGDSKLNFLPTGVTTKNLKLDLPSDPSITYSADRQTINFDSSYLPFNTPLSVFVFNLLKLILLGLVIFLILKAINIDCKLKIEPWIFLTIIVGSIVWCLTTVFSGSHTIFGLSFWGPQGHDAFVHLSLIESFKQSFWPLNNPTLVNTTVINYHILFDMLTALLSKFLAIPALDLYFRYLPPVLAVSIGILSAKLLRKWKISNFATTISLLLIYGAGSLGFVAGGGESVFWSNQAASTLLNPPYALSLVMLLLWLNIFSEKLTIRRVIFLSILGGLLIQAKSYSAVLLIFSLGAFLLSSVLKHKLNRLHILLFILTAILTIVFLLPTYAPSRSIFIFSPLWFTRSLVSSPDRLPWPAAANALFNYPFNGVWYKFILLELLLTTVFFIGNFGIRLFALPQMLKKNQSSERQIINGVIVIGCVLPLLLIQTANPWNTIQFFYYSLFFTALLSGPAIADLLYSFRRLPAFLLMFALLTIVAFTTTVGTIKDYVSPTPASFIGYTELNLIDQLSRLPRGLVISPEYNLSESRPYSAPKPIFAYITTSYVSALSGQPSYIADNINLAISNYSYTKQSLDQQRLYRTSDVGYVSNFLKDKGISYVYTNSQFQLKADPAGSGLVPIFDSGYFNLYYISK